MIFDWVIVGVSTIIGFIAQYLPDSNGFTSQVTNSIEGIASYFFMVDMVIAIDDLFAALLVLVAFEATLAGVNIARWFVRSTPFLNSRI